MLDAEAKLLAVSLLDGSQHPPTQILPAPKSALLCDLAIKGGSADVQRLNTGLPGSRLRMLADTPESDPFATRIGVERWNEFKGYAGLVET